jgi:hypothetical protein
MCRCSPSTGGVLDVNGGRGDGDDNGGHINGDDNDGDFVQPQQPKAPPPIPRHAGPRYVFAESSAGDSDDGDDDVFGTLYIYPPHSQYTRRVHIHPPTR